MNDSIKTYKVGEFLVQENGIVRSKAGRIIGKLSDFPEHITEILPDLDKMPEWAREAFEAGQFFDVAFKRVKRLEQTITALEAEKAELAKKWREEADRRKENMAAGGARRPIKDLDTCADELLKQEKKP